MDICRKFIQMGRTRSLRYALRRGGKKYTTDAKGNKEAMKRTGEVYDEGKLRGANVFEGYLDRCWADEEYKGAFERWRKGVRWGPTPRKDEAGVKVEEMDEGVDVKLEDGVEARPASGDEQVERQVKKEMDR